MLSLLLAPETYAAIQVISPDNKVRFELTEGPTLTYAISFRDKSVIDPSPLGILLENVELSRGAEVGKAERYEVKEHYPWRGVHAWATNHCNGARIQLNHAALKTNYIFEVRAFNDGVAFRHIIPGNDTPRVPDESTRFILPASSTLWMHDLGGHYEAVHSKKNIAEVQAGEWVAPPLTFKLPGSIYASITEAALVNYSGMAGSGLSRWCLGTNTRFPIPIGCVTATTSHASPSPPKFPGRLHRHGEWS